MSADRGIIIRINLSQPSFILLQCLHVCDMQVMIYDTIVCDVLQMGDVSLFRLAILCILNLGYFGECLRDTHLGDPCSRTGNKKRCVLVAGDRFRP